MSPPSTPVPRRNSVAQSAAPGEINESVAAAKDVEASAKQKTKDS